jgi:hypothetical protein
LKELVEQMLEEQEQTEARLPADGHPTPEVSRDG